jgi:hypothetical protein
MLGRGIAAFFALAATVTCVISKQHIVVRSGVPLPVDVDRTEAVSLLAMYMGTHHA